MFYRIAGAQVEQLSSADRPTTSRRVLTAAPVTQIERDRFSTTGDTASKYTRLAIAQT